MLHLANVSFGYGRRVVGEPLFSGLDLDISRGGIYGLLGRNGAGKSTLLKLMTGCLRPTEGSVEVFGRPAFSRRPESLRRLYFLPEQVYLPARTWQVLARAYGPFYPNFDAAEFEALLEELEVPRDRKLERLSLGQKKKGLVAFALACNTELLVLDEPTNGLDIPSKARLRSILARAVTDERAVVVSTHQVRDLTGLIDPVIVLEAGRVVAHLDLQAVSERLSFELVSSLAPPADALFAERVPGGHYVVRDNRDGRHAEPDLEVLFNAVVQPGSRVLAALQGSPTTLAHEPATHSNPRP